MNTVASSSDFAKTDIPLTVQLARATMRGRQPAITAAARAKLRLCILDFFACALEARSLPWARQAAGLAEGEGGRCTIIGSPRKVFADDAAFANAVAAHGLVREDMHTGSVSHFGVVVLPALLAVAQDNGLSGSALADAAIVGYEVGSKIGRALITPEFARSFRPTGFTGPIAAAAGLCHLLQLDEADTASAIAFAANMAGGLNQWPHTGADDMYFHAGQAASSAFRAVRLAKSGARGSERALDGEAGLLRVYRPDRTVPVVRLFDGPELEIMSVYFKAVPVCNFAQTPCQVAIALISKEKIDLAQVRSIRVRVSEAARAYPGCDYAGPFQRVLQAKMSIHFAVASALLHGAVNEASYRQLNDPELIRLAGLVDVEADQAMTAAFPKAQGAEVTVTLNSGQTYTHRLSDTAPADSTLIRSRFAATASDFAGKARAQEIEAAVDGLDSLTNIGQLMRLVAGPVEHR